MAVLYYTRFQSIALNNYEVELWSDATGTSPLQAFNAYKQRVIADGGYIEDEEGLLTSLRLLSGTEELMAATPGFTIERQGESDTFFDNPIRASRCSAFFVVKNNTDLSAFEGIATDPEGTYVIKLYKNTALYFVGRVLADQMRFERGAVEGKLVIEVAAVDALNLIEGFYVDPAWFTDDHASALDVLTNCLELSGLTDYFSSTDNYIFDGLEQYETATQSVSSQKLATFWLNQLAFVDNLDVFGGFELSWVNAKQALEIILNGFGARIHHTDGAFYITQAPSYLSSTLVFHKYTKGQTYNGTSTISHAVSLGADERPQWAAKPSLYYQPPFRLAENNYIKANGAYIKKANFTDPPLSLEFDRPPQDYNFRVQINVESVKPPARSYHRLAYKVYGLSAANPSLYYVYSGYNWNSQSTVPQYLYTAYKEQGIATFGVPTSLTLDFIGPIATGPAGAITSFVVEITVQAITPVWVRDPVSGGWWQSSSLTYLNNVGSIAAAYAYNTYTPGTPDEFKKELVTKATNSLGGNSIVKELSQIFYDGSTSYEAGTIFVGSSFASAVAPTSWGVGWEAGYSETFQQTHVDQVIAIYSKFKNVIRGTWHDAGSLNAIKSLYFDSKAWLLNGSTFSAQYETWEGEWLSLEVDYAEVVQTGDEDDIRPSERVYFEDQVEYLRARIGNVEQITGNLPGQLLEDFIEVSEGAPTSDPGSDGTYTLAMAYDAANTNFSWQMRQLGKSLNVTSDITTFPTEYEIFVCDTSAASITIDLPAPPSVTPGLRFGFVKTNSNHSVILDAGAGYQINDTQLLSWSSKWETYWVQSDGVQWYIVASNK